MDYKHGELVSVGHKGVWNEALLPGKYAFNTFAGQIIPVPTTNIVLKWVNNVTGGHKYDENLMAVELITQDAFEPLLPLSVVIHIDYRKAPRVIQRFGHVKKLVEQTLDPMVSAFFKNIGQKRTLIHLIQERSEIQQTSHKEMHERFAHYDLELEEVLIGTPSPSERDDRIEHILAQLRDRQIAMEQVETYSMQERAAVEERLLKEAQAKAAQQPRLTESEIMINVRSNEGEAEYRRSLQEADQIRTLARAEAEKDARLGVARAIAVEEQVRAYGGPDYQVLQQVMNRFSEAVERSGVEIVPRMVMNASGETGQGHSAFEALIAVMMSERFGLGEDLAKIGTPRERSETIEVLRKQIMDSMKESGDGGRDGADGQKKKPAAAHPSPVTPVRTRVVEDEMTGAEPPTGGSKQAVDKTQGKQRKKRKRITKEEKTARQSGIPLLRERPQDAIEW